MPKVRWCGPDVYRPHSSQRGYFAPLNDDPPPRSTTRNYAPTPQRADPDEIAALATHEASHAAIALLQRRGIESVTIDRDNVAGLCSLSSVANFSMRRHMRFLLAGELGSLRAGLSPSAARAGARTDLKEAEKLPAELLGLDPDDLSDDDEDAIEELLDEERAKASRALDRNWNLVKEIADELETRGRLNPDHIARIVEDFPLEYPPQRAAPTPVKRTESLEIRRLPFGLCVSRDMPIIGKSFDATTGSCDACISTGAAVRRSDWSGDEFDEVLEISERAVRLERLNAGAQLLDSHRWYGGLDAIIGGVIPGSARIENGELRARFRFSNGDLGQRVAKDVRDGLPLQLSCGYRVFAYREDTKSSPPVRRIVDWEPYEISVVAIAAEPVGTGFRSHMMMAA